MAEKRQPSPDAVLRVAVDILNDMHGSMLRHTKYPKLLRSLAENFIVEALGGKPPCIIEAIEFQEAVKTENT